MYTTSSLLQKESLDLVSLRLVHLSAICLNFHFLLLWRSVTVLGSLKTPGVNTWSCDQGKASTLPRQAGPVIIIDCAGCYLVPKKKGSAIGFYVSWMIPHAKLNMPHVSWCDFRHVTPGWCDFTMYFWDSTLCAFMMNKSRPAGSIQQPTFLLATEPKQQQGMMA